MKEGTYLRLRKMDEDGSHYRLEAVNRHGDKITSGNLLDVFLKEGVIEGRGGINKDVVPAGRFQWMQG